MSWSIFKENLIRRLCNANQVPNIETVANAFAEEYDAAIKRGGTIPDNIKVQSGDVPTMKLLFTTALEQGLSKVAPYDLVGEMGKGVKAYWSKVKLSPFPTPLPTPLQLSNGVSANIYSISNIIDNSGVWKSAEDFVDTVFDAKRNVETDDYDVIVNGVVDNTPVSEEEYDMPLISADFNLVKIPDKLNNYRSAQIPVVIKPDGTIDGPYPDIIKKYGIKTIIRMNGDGNDGRKSRKWPITTKDTEKKMCEKLGCTFYYINAHGAEEPGNGYQVTNKKITEILKQGNVLIHCAHGADRTGGHVAGYLKKTGVITDLDKLWDYTVQYNSWLYYIKNGKYFGTTFEKYGNTFYPQDLLRQKFSKSKPKTANTTPPSNTNPPDPNAKKILIVGDSISVNLPSTWAYQWKLLSTGQGLNLEILAEGGQQLTRWMKPQLEAKLKTNKYDKIFVYGGVNDCWSGKKAETILEALQSMVDTIKATGAQPVVVTGFDAELDMDIKKIKWDDEKIDTPALAQYRKFQSLIASTIKGAKIVPKISLGVIGDGFHPSSGQAKKLYQHISKY